MWHHIAPASSSQPHPRPQPDWSPQGARVPNLLAVASQRNRVGEKEKRSVRLRGELMISRNRISESHRNPAQTSSLKKVLPGGGSVTQFPGDSAPRVRRGAGVHGYSG